LNSSSPQTAWITTRRPNGPADTGESAAIHYVVADGVVKVTDQDGHMLRYADGEPCKQALGPHDNPKQIAVRLGRRYHEQIYGDRERGFWRDINRRGGTPV
jgi:hypothetical protein